MKKSNVVLSVVLILLVLVGWGAQFLNIAKTNAQYNAYLQQANQYSEAGLYQKAVQSYESAFQIKDNHSVRNLWIDAYSKAFSDKAVTLNSYVGALETMCDIYEKETVHWETLIRVQLDNGRIDNAHDTYLKFKKAGLSSTVIDEYKNTIIYQFRINRKPYEQVVRNSTGYYTVKDSQGWGIIRPNGETVYNCVYEYISPYNANYDALFVSEKGQRIADAKAVVQAKINIEYTKTGAWVDGLLPVCDSDANWYYLNCVKNEKAHGSYTKASNYTDGIAAVCKGNEWILVDTDGNSLNIKKFSDIKLHGNGDYQYGGIMIAAENGEYGIYNAKGERISELHAKDMDVYMGGPIAYCDNATGKWGMVSHTGDVVITPSYEEAKSYSNNLAAISNGEMWGFINQSGELVIDYQFHYADYFTDKGLCAVSTAGHDYVFIQLKYIDD